MAIVYLLALVFIFYLLAKICDQYFVKSLDILSKKLKISEDVAGATFMAVGSSAPEFFTALIAVTKVGSEQVGSGTIVGSAIFNILVIVGASALVATSYLSWKPVIRDMIFYIISIIVLLVTFQDGIITIWEAGLYILSYVVYIGVLVKWKQISGYTEKSDELEMVSHGFEEEEKRAKKSRGVFHLIEKYIDTTLSYLFPNPEKRKNGYVITFTISIISIIVLSWALVEIAILLAHDLGIPEVIIALTILAGGTSIPDLLSSLIVARQGRGDMAVSNAVGSNIFDILICLGFPWMLYILYTGKPMIVATENLISSILLLFFTVISLLFLLLFHKFKLGRQSGFLLLLVYGVYLVYSLYVAYAPKIS